MDDHEPSTHEIGERVELVGKGDAKNCRIDGKDEEEDVGDMTGSDLS
jgi:hypothetical protein